MGISRDEVLCAYRLLLGREPESEEVVRQHMQLKGYEELRQSFLGSAEFQQKFAQYVRPDSIRLPLELPRNDIEHTATDVQLQAILKRIEDAWTHLGVVTPHFSVLTNNAFLPDNLADNLVRFWKSGENEAKKIELMLLRHGFKDLGSKVCLEYGCGVGRVTMGLATRFSQVYGYDISLAHLALAKERADQIGFANCVFRHASADFLSRPQTCDFLYSRIVFQHNPPPVICALIRSSLRALLPGGVAIFQVPVYELGYRFSVAEWLAAAQSLDMQMHAVNQDVVFSIIRSENCELLEVREDDSVGYTRQRLSNTFVVRSSSSK